MRSIEWNAVPVGKFLVLLTMEDVQDGSPVMMADFQDVNAIFHRGLRRWVGMSRTRGMRLGIGEPELKNGIWYVEEDVKSARLVQDLSVKAEDLFLKRIEP